MSNNAVNVEQLPTEADKIGDTQECLKYIQLQISSDLQLNVEHLLLHIRAVINKELWQQDDKICLQFNQVVVNVAFRCYFQLLKKYNLEDFYYGQYIETHFEQNFILKEKNFIVLQAIMLTNQNLVKNPMDLHEKIFKALILAIDSHHVSLVSILKAFNLFHKKFPKLNIRTELSLDYVYSCLQSNQMAMRDECMTMLQYICLNHEHALEYFECVVNYWAWTNRNKLFVLSSILNQNSLDNFLHACDHSKENFFSGLRSTLSYKNLLAPSQYIVKALSAQKSMEMLELSVNILTKGNKKEIKNFYSQWFSRVQQKDELFEMLQQKPEIALFIDNSSDYLMDNEHSYRLILILSMFSKQVFQLSKLHFFKLSTELLTNCFQYDTECQLLIFKFIVDNLANFAIEDCMEFVDLFLKTHSSLENAQFRNTVLGKIPNILNYIAKTFCRLCLNNEQTTSLESSILNFFSHLHIDIEIGIASCIYQPKIFYLKLLEILLKSLYLEVVSKNSKSCSVTHNQNLGLFLKKNNVFDQQVMAMRLMDLINDPLGFDDALDLIVSLITIIKPQEIVMDLALDLSLKACSLADVDECNLSFLYTRVGVQISRDDKKLKEFLKIIFIKLQLNIVNFDKDPLVSFKTQGGHLFGLLNTLVELTELKPSLCAAEFLQTLTLLEDIQRQVLKKLNKSTLENVDDFLGVASFEEMDKSLEILVCQSAYHAENHEKCRKFILMSFWLTLKSCCDLASAMASYEVKTKYLSEQSCSFIQRCLQINVKVLTKCRHKGAIESAGISIGKLTKSITSSLSDDTAEYNLLHLYLEQLYQVEESNISTTRRGAGFSIMFLHIVKNEKHRGRPILKKAVENLLNSTTKTENSNMNFNCDRLETLYLHFLCVLVRDTELREAMTKYYNEIMTAAIDQIDNPEWTICNAALQLFGALVSKIVGQNQANEFEDPLQWEPSAITLSEINRKLPKAFTRILYYGLAGKISTRSIILFLEFLHKVEYINKGTTTTYISVHNYRQLTWSLLKHNSEKVRVLAAKCFIRSLDFRVDLPETLMQITNILFSLKNENFFEGLLYALHEGILKLKHESKYIIDGTVYQEIIDQIKQNLHDTFPCKLYSYNFFTLCKLWDLLTLLDHFVLINNIKTLAQPLNMLNKMFGYDLWLERIQETVNYKNAINE